MLPPSPHYSGVNYEWWQEFSDQAAGLGITFRPTIIGFGAVLDNLSGFLDNQHRLNSQHGLNSQHRLNRRQDLNRRQHLMS